jgi:hypothetical protein
MRSVRPPSHAQEPRRRSDDNEVPIAQEPSSQAEDANGAGRPWAGTPSPFVTMATCLAGVWSRSPFRISPSPSWAVCTIRSNRRSPCATDSTLLNVEGRRRQIKNAFDRNTYVCTVAALFGTGIAHGCEHVTTLLHSNTPQHDHRLVSAVHPKTFLLQTVDQAEVTLTGSST